MKLETQMAILLAINVVIVVVCVVRLVQVLLRHGRKQSEQEIARKDQELLLQSLRQQNQQAAADTQQAVMTAVGTLGQSLRESQKDSGRAQNDTLKAMELRLAGIEQMNKQKL